MKVHVKSYGCSANHADKLLESLIKNTPRSNPRRKTINASLTRTWRLASRTSSRSRANAQGIIQ